MTQCGVAFNCILCNKAGNDNMVTCSNCLHSYHKVCCKMGSAADIFFWKCLQCTLAADQQKATPDSPNTSLNSSVELVEEFLQQPSSRNLSKTHDPEIHMSYKGSTQLQLQELEEEMLLKAEYVRRKYELLRSANVEEDFNATGSQARQLQPVAECFIHSSTF